MVSHMSDKSAIYVTPPTIFLPNTGIKFHLISTDEEWIRETCEALEKGFRTTKLTFYHTESEETAETICWQMLYVPFSDFVLIDSSSLTMAQSIIGARHMEAGNVWWCADDNTDIALLTMLNTLGAKLYDDVEWLIETIKRNTND